MPSEVQSTPYGEAGEALRRRFAWLQHRARPDLCTLPGDTIPAQHDSALDALSFYASVNGEIVSHAAVLRKNIQHGAQTFNVAGLGSVATDRDYQGRGFGPREVAAATRWIEQRGVDFGIFTCDPPLALFYARAGAWAIARDVVVIGSQGDGALRSDTLGKVVLMRLFSAKAIAAASTLTHATIDLDLPVGQFW